MKEHKWWHFIYGTEAESEVVHEDNRVRTSNFWYVCKKCKKQLTEKEGCTTLTFHLPITK